MEEEKKTKFSLVFIYSVLVISAYVFLSTESADRNAGMRLTCMKQPELVINFSFLDFKNEVCGLSFIRTVAVLRLGIK